jgi:hypothetical protein
MPTVSCHIKKEGLPLIDRILHHEHKGIGILIKYFKINNDIKN